VRPVLEVLAVREVRRPLLGAAVGRLTPGMVLLSLILSARAADLPYTGVGLLVAAHQLGVSVGSPFQGRFADRLGHARVLVPDAAAYLAGTVLLAVGLGRGWPTGLLLVVAAATGLANPPTTPCSRALLVRLVLPGRARAAAFAISGASAELGFILGPLTVVALAAAVGPRAALVTAGVTAAVGALVYSSAPAAREPAPAPAAGSTRPGLLAVLRAPGLVPLAAAFLLASVGFGAFDLYVAAFGEARGTPGLAGPLIALTATLSLAAGFAYAARVWSGPPLSRQARLTAAPAGALLLMPAAGDRLLLLALALVVVGATVGPFNVAGFQLAGELAPEHARTEAQAWTQAAIYLGSALGGALAGAVIDRAGAATAMVVGAAAVMLGAVVLTAGTPPRPRPSRGSGWTRRDASGSPAGPSPAPAAQG
jgi:MFS family permease